VGGYNTKNVAGEEQHSLIQVGLLKSTAEKKVRVKKKKTTKKKKKTLQYIHFLQRAGLAAQMSKTAPCLQHKITNRHDNHCKPLHTSRALFCYRHKIGYTNKKNIATCFIDNCLIKCN